MKKIFGKIWKEFLDTIFPIECIGCGKVFEELPEDERWICPDCLLKINLRLDQVCPVCEKASEGGKTHKFCRDKTALDGLWAGVYYEDLVEKAIHYFKFNFVQTLCKPLSRFIISGIRESKEFGDFHNILFFHKSREDEEGIYIGKSEIDRKSAIIIPVPLHHKRYNWRGFNQSELLADLVAKEFDLVMRNDILRRHINTKPQSKIDNEFERKLNIRGAFACVQEHEIKGANVVIVDDVCTTLSTLGECASELKKAGAAKVWALVVARR